MDQVKIILGIEITTEEWGNVLYKLQCTATNSKGSSALSSLWFNNPLEREQPCFMQCGHKVANYTNIFGPAPKILLYWQDIHSRMEVYSVLINLRLEVKINIRFFD